MAGDQETATPVPMTAGGELVPASARPPGTVAIAAELLARTHADVSGSRGEHYREVLSAHLGLAADDVKELRAGGAFG
jgi:hypothetical protein